MTARKIPLFVLLSLFVALPGYAQESKDEVKTETKESKDSASTTANTPATQPAKPAVTKAPKAPKVNCAKVVRDTERQARRCLRIGKFGKRKTCMNRVGSKLNEFCQKELRPLKGKMIALERKMYPRQASAIDGSRGPKRNYRKGKYRRHKRRHHRRYSKGFCKRAKRHVMQKARNCIHKKRFSVRKRCVNKVGKIINRRYKRCERALKPVQRWFVAQERRRYPRQRSVFGGRGVASVKKHYKGQKHAGKKHACATHKRNKIAKKFYDCNRKFKAKKKVLTCLARTNKGLSKMYPQKSGCWQFRKHIYNARVRFANSKGKKVAPKRTSYKKVSCNGQQLRQMRNKFNKCVRNKKSRRHAYGCLNNVNRKMARKFRCHHNRVAIYKNTYKRLSRKFRRVARYKNKRNRHYRRGHKARVCRNAKNHAYRIGNRCLSKRRFSARKRCFQNMKRQVNKRVRRYNCRGIMNSVKRTFAAREKRRYRRQPSSFYGGRHHNKYRKGRRGIASVRGNAARCATLKNTVSKKAKGCLQNPNWKARKKCVNKIRRFVDGHKLGSQCGRYLDGVKHEYQARERRQFRHQVKKWGSSAAD